MLKIKLKLSRSLAPPSLALCALVAVTGCGDDLNFSDSQAIPVADDQNYDVFDEVEADQTTADILADDNPWNPYDSYSEESSKPPLPEDEVEGDFQIPRSSGKFVYSTNETTDRVAVIDTTSRRINVVDAGRQPTIVAPLATTSDKEGRVAVLNSGSDDVSILHTKPDGTTTVTQRSVTAGANNIAVSPDGRWVVVYHDADFDGASNSGSDQEVTVLLADDESTSYKFAVGAHPRNIVFRSDSEIAYVITADGVNVVRFDELATKTKPKLVAVVNDLGIDPSLVEIQVSPEPGVAIARIEAETHVIVTDLETEIQTKLKSGSEPTDLDISSDGSFAILTVPEHPSPADSSVIEIPLPLVSEDDAEITIVNDEYVGVAELSPDGETMLLYTTVYPWQFSNDERPDPRKRLTVAHRGDTRWETGTAIFSEIPIRSAGIAPDSRNAILLHEEDGGLNPDAPWPYTMVDLTASFPVKKLQSTEAKPRSIIFTPDGDRALVLMRDGKGEHKRVDVVNLNNFIVDSLKLGSPPQSAGYVEATDKIFVAQDHAAGRISFIDSDGDVKTATGFELNDSIKD